MTRLSKQQHKELEEASRASNLSITEFFIRFPSLETWCAKKKHIEIIINPYRINCMSYNAIKEYIALPNIGRPEVDILAYDNIKYWYQTFTHEIIHRLIHEMVGLKACCQWDIIDIGKVDYGYYLVSSI